MLPTQEIISEIKALSSHYPKRARSPADEQRWLMDWANDLGSYSTADVRMACAQWRSGVERRMPSPGELIAKCRNLVKYEPLRIASPPPPPQFSAEHRQQMQAELQALATDLAAKKSMRGPLQRRAGETEVQQARRLWPSHEVNHSTSKG